MTELGKTIYDSMYANVHRVVNIFTSVSSRDVTNV